MHKNIHQKENIIRVTAQLKLNRTSIMPIKDILNYSMWHIACFCRCGNKDPCCGILRNEKEGHLNSIIVCTCIAVRVLCPSRDVMTWKCFPHYCVFCVRNPLNKLWNKYISESCFHMTSLSIDSEQQIGQFAFVSGMIDIYLFQSSILAGLMRQTPNTKSFFALFKNSKIH